MSNSQCNSQKLLKFTRTLSLKCEKENADFDKEFKKINLFSKLSKDDYIFAMQDARTFKEKFLVPNYKMFNLLSLVNQTIFYLRKRNLTLWEIESSVKELENFKTELANSRIELYFCNVCDNESLKPLANIFMPYGLLHVGILLDEVCIQWGRSVIGKSLVNPSADTIYNDFIFAIELENQQIWNLIKETYNHLEDYITNKRDYNQMGTKIAFDISNNQLDLIANECVNYNENKDYNIVFQNCQHFANNIIDKLGFKVNTSGEVGKVLNKAKDKLNPFTFEFKGTAFETRKDLDNFILINEFNDFSPEERRLLLCYRNVFDYYERFKPNEKKYQSSEIARAYWNEFAEKVKFG